MLNNLNHICFYGGGVGIDLSKPHKIKLEETSKRVTKEFLQKYFEGNEEILCCLSKFL